MQNDNNSKGSCIPDMYSPRGEERYFSPLHRQIIKNLLRQTSYDTKQNT